jgi:hypothetical protein
LTALWDFDKFNACPGRPGSILPAPCSLSGQGASTGPRSSWAIRSRNDSLPVQTGRSWKGSVGKNGLGSYFVADTVQTKITDAQMTKVNGRYMIATEYRFCQLGRLVPVQVQFRDPSERGDPIKGEGGQNKEIRAEDPSFLRVGECGEDRRDKVDPSGN